MKTKTISNLQCAICKNKKLSIALISFPIVNFLLLITYCLLPTISSAQSKFMLGPSYTFGASGIYGNKMAMSGMAMTSNAPMTEYALKLNSGVGLRAEYFFSEKLGITLQSGYMQRGSLFDKESADYSPRYKLNYIDVLFGLQYRTNMLMKIKNHKDFITLGASQHTLLNAYRANSYNAVNITSEIKMFDWGVFIGVGHNIPFFEKDLLQIQLFANAGLTNIFTGTFEMNGISGKNILYGLQLSYLLGKNPTPKN